ncbi:polysaccharide deacetylase family protein [Arcobacter sp. 15-2]|uniref:polysaccharide deacetylase family protein n=1 Tax=Arcobacter sp. 15-2 TaxID=3374109 RepID=UPI00399CE849
MKYLFLLIISTSYIFANAHIFVYHRFADERYKSANTTLKELTRQFEYFKSNNYEVVPLSKILDKLEKKESIPEKWIALTIDDAYKSFYDHGLEVFKKYNYPFSLYVYVKATEKHYGDYMSWEQIKESSKYGEIGLHSYSHPRLQNLSQKEIVEDTKKAFDIFVKNTNITPTTYAYPYGEFNEEVTNTLKTNFNFRAILNQNTGSVNQKTNIYDIPRIALVGDVNINHKLRYKTFDATWIEPKQFPKDGVLKKITVQVDPKYKKLKLYITSEGWRDVTVKNGLVDLNLNIYLKRARTRVILGPNVFTISNKIINKIKTKKGE